MEILLSNSTRDYGYVITTVVINGSVYALARTPKQDFKRMEAFSKGAYEQFQFDIINAALEAYFKGERVNDY